MAKTESKSKTFHKGDDAMFEIYEFINKHIDTDDYTPEGVASYSDGLSPHDPRQDLKHKYVITVTKILEDGK